MTKREIINQLEALPVSDDTQVVIFDWRKNLGNDDGEGSREGWYEKLDIDLINHNLSDDEKIDHFEITGFEPEVFITISFENNDYNDYGSLVEEIIESANSQAKIPDRVSFPAQVINMAEDNTSYNFVISIGDAFRAKIPGKGDSWKGFVEYMGTEIPCSFSYFEENFLALISKQFLQKPLPKMIHQIFTVNIKDND